MEKKMVITGRKISFAEAEELDLISWANRTVRERLEETERLRRMIWTQLLGYYPNKMEKKGEVVKYSAIDKL